MAENHNSGRPAKPLSWHKLNGSYKPSRHGNRQESPGVLPLPADRFEPPSWLDQTAREFWLDNRDELLRLELLDALTYLSFSVLCEVWSMHRKLAAIVADCELVITTPRGVQQAHPAIKAHYAVSNQLMAMLEKWGMTPKGRRGLGIKGILKADDDGEDDLAEYSTSSQYDLSGRVPTRNRSQAPDAAAILGFEPGSGA